VNRREASFLVSAPIGSENWKTARKPLNRKELLFPGRGRSLNHAGKQENKLDEPAIQVSDGAHPGAPKITRIYRLGPASDELIEALYELLASADGADAETTSMPCFSAQPE
jgi:hypothetical protein